MSDHMNTATIKTTDNIDPLFVVFEHHLFSFTDSNIDRKGFIAQVVGDYLNFLKKNHILVPITLEKYVIEELSIQVNTMLIKKIYGFLTIEDYQRNASVTDRTRAGDAYKKLRTPRRRSSSITG